MRRHQAPYLGCSAQLHTVVLRRVLCIRSFPRHVSPTLRIASRPQITHLGHLNTLQSLLLPGNSIRSIRGLESLTELSHLDLSRNMIGRLQDVRALTLNPKLHTLSLQGNPVTKLPPSARA